MGVTRTEAHQVIFDRARGAYDGRTIVEWMPQAVEDIASAFDPAEIIVFGSIARGDATADSDLDLLVVFDDLSGADLDALQRQVRLSITAPVPCDVVVTDRAERDRRQMIPGSLHRRAAMEGRVVYARAA